MKLYQQRVYAQHEELMKRREKLEMFVQSIKFSILPREEQGRILHQSQIMEQYANILGERIAAFPTD